MRPFIRPTLLGLAVAAAILFVGLIAVGAAASSMPKAGVTAAPSSTPTAAPTPMPDRTQVENYVRVVSEDTGRLARALNEMEISCGSGDKPTCLLDTERVSREAQRFLHDLAMNPAPPCVELPDREFRAGLHDYDRGAQLGAQGLDAGDPFFIRQGADLIGQGHRHMKRATDLTRYAVC